MNPLLTIFMITALGVGLPPFPASGSDLSAYRWKNRLLILFAPAESDPGLAAFNRSLTHRISEVQDRDLIVFRVFEKTPMHLERRPLSPEDAEKLRRRFRPRSGRFTVILIGKDGGIKMVREDPAELREIFDLIDSMPMRQQEMRETGDAR